MCIRYPLPAATLPAGRGETVTFRSFVRRRRRRAAYILRGHRKGLIQAGDRPRLLALLLDGLLLIGGGLSVVLDFHLAAGIDKVVSVPCACGQGGAAKCETPIEGVFKDEAADVYARHMQEEQQGIDGDSTEETNR
ncbi:hypothetical protein GGX14DRAFT_401017 [Mycena pura]|uniref:Uncharacterized protein n=1 Tax=Mycena pura TaxID=153505 RepID=A0AAD6V503_9AGAR|nr:hypothetical protein GGX14DRAFT_401017 [Mycena pura]